MQLMRHIMERWKEGRVSGLDGLMAFAREAGATCGPATNLYVYDLRPDSPLLFGVETLTENVDMKSGRAKTVGSYPDQGYVHRDVVPHYMQAKLSGEASAMRMRSVIQGHVAVYDRLILPMRGAKGAQWALSMTRTLALTPPAPGTADLTERQGDILFLLSGGLTSKEAAVRLGISPRTVDHLAEAARRKLGARNTSHAVAIYVGRATADDGAPHR